MLRTSILKLALIAQITGTALLLEAAPVIETETTSILSSSDTKLDEALQKIVAERPPVDSFGVVLANIHDFSPELAPKAKKELQFNDRLQIVSVVKGSIADQLGLKPGDQLLQINSFYVSRGQTALKQFAERVEPGVEWHGSLNTTIIRDGFGQNHSLPASDSKG